MILPGPFGPHPASDLPVVPVTVTDIDAKDVLRKLLAALASETASLELRAAKVIGERRDGVLQFPWRKPWNGVERRTGEHVHYDHRPHRA